MKKLIIGTSLTLAIAVILLLLASTGITFAYVSESSCDTVFRETLAEMLDDSYNDQELTARKTLLYDIEEEPMGYLYDFSIEQKNGYAIVINVNGDYVATEVFFDATSPYAACKGLPVYVYEMTYADHRDGLYYINNSEIGIDKATALDLFQNSYCAGSGLSEESTTINYVYKSESKKKLATVCPDYIGTENVTNACAAVAGANLIAYYDRFSTNLIPSYDPGYGLGSLYKYKVMNTTIDALVEDLYIKMKTNQGAPGTTAANCKNGIESYSRGKGYNVSFAFQGNYSNMKNSLDNGKPLILFLSSYCFSNILELTNSDVIYSNYSTLNHAVAGFGYREITYTLSSGHRIDQYIFIASGLAAASSGYLNINYRTTIDECYSVNIY